MAVSISNLSTTFANSSFTYNAISMNVNASSYAANSTLLNLKTNGNTKFSVDVDGVITASPLVISTSNIERMRITPNGFIGIGTSLPNVRLQVEGTINDSIGNVRDIPINNQTGAYIATINDVGKTISITTGGVTIPNAIFSPGDVFSIYNNSGSNQTITQGVSVTMYLGGTATTGNRTLAQRGLSTVLCVAANNFVISGVGLT